MLRRRDSRVLVPADIEADADGPDLAEPAAWRRRAGGTLRQSRFGFSRWPSPCAATTGRAGPSGSPRAGAGRRPGWPGRRATMAARADRVIPRIRRILRSRRPVGRGRCAGRHCPWSRSRVRQRALATRTCRNGGVFADASVRPASIRPTPCPAGARPGRTAAPRPGRSPCRYRSTSAATRPERRLQKVRDQAETVGADRDPQEVADQQEQGRGRGAHRRRGQMLDGRRDGPQPRQDQAGGDQEDREGHRPGRALPPARRPASRCSHGQQEAGTEITKAKAGVRGEPAFDFAPSRSGHRPAQPDAQQAAPKKAMPE